MPVLRQDVQRVVDGLRGTVEPALDALLGGMGPGPMTPVDEADIPQLLQDVNDAISLIRQIIFIVVTDQKIAQIEIDRDD